VRLITVIYRVHSIVWLEVNDHKIKYMVMFGDRNAGRSHSIKIDSSPFQRVVEEFKYLGTTITDQNSIQEEIKSGLNSANACCYSVKNLLSSSLLYENLKVKTYQNYNFACCVVWV